MVLDLFAIGLPLIVAVTCVCSCMLLLRLSEGVPPTDRQFMDPLPRGLRPIWPLVRIVAFHITGRLPYTLLRLEEKRLQKNGVSYRMITEEFEALRLIFALFALLLGWLLLPVIEFWHPLLFIILPLLGFFYPDIWIRDTRKRQVDEILRTLPAFLDFITMGMEAGQNFSSALELAMDKGPGGPLANEFGIVLRDIHSGLTRAQALRRMARRLGLMEMNSFVSSVVQAEKMGASLAATLRAQAQQRRVERFQRAEKKAMEAPVKLVGPLMLFIFPTTFLVLAFPLLMKVIHGGLF